MGQSPFARRESEGPSRGESWPKPYGRALGSLGIQPRTIQSSADPKSHKKRGVKAGVGSNLKENLRISGKAAFIAIQCPAPDRAVFFSFINHPPQFWDGTDGTNVSLVKVDPTRGRRTASTG